ncbi:hypothetical protein SLH47_26200, partial [Cognatiyoonia sp. IB215182]|nr:hypothetical protein [Cognatiyoonia sp. IB215182]
MKILSEGLYAELLETPVRVSTVFPGAIGTNMMANSNVKNPMGDSATAKPPPSTAPDVAAKTILDGMERDRFQIMVGKDARMMNLLYLLNHRLHEAFAPVHRDGVSFRSLP